MYYTDTAYRSDNIPDLPPAPAGNSGFWAQMGLRAGRKLQYNNKEVLQTDLALRWKPSEIRAQEQEPASSMLDNFCTHERISTVQPPFWFRLIIFLEMFARWGVGPIVVCGFFVDNYIFFSGIFDQSEEQSYFSIDSFKPTIFMLGVALTLALPAYIIGEVLPRLNIKLNAFPVFELNRRTGMVTVYRKGKLYYSHPFVEFDAYLGTLADHQGSPHYFMNLVHRYHQYDRACGLSDLTSRIYREDNIYTLWPMIQQYMDVTRPLPDMLFLEPYRQLDPTTKAHDAATGRPERYWRDMNDEEYERIINQQDAEQRKALKRDGLR